MMAIGSLHRDQCEALESRYGSLPATDSNFALHHYNQAMKHFVKHLSQDRGSIQIPLTMCILFICLEFLRSDIDRAMMHMQSGFAILGTQKARALDSPGRNDVIMGHLRSAFSRLKVLSTLFGRPTQYVFTNVTLGESYLDTCNAFISIPQARAELVNLMNSSLLFTNATCEMKYSFDIGVGIEEIAEQVRLKALLDRWHTAFQSLITSQPDMTAAEHDGCRMLLIYHKVTYVWLSTALTPNETAFDNHSTVFEQVINLAATLLRTSTSSSLAPSPGFSFEMGLIPPLYYTAFKCRIPTFRRRAISLLSAAPRREGLWDAFRARKIAERIVTIEEAGLEHFAETSCPPEAARIHTINELPADLTRIQDADMNHQHSLAHKHFVAFRMKPNGLQGDWHLRNESIEIDMLSCGTCSDRVHKTPTLQVMHCSWDPTSQRLMQALKT